MFFRPNRRRLYTCALSSDRLCVLRVVSLLHLRTSTWRPNTPLTTSPEARGGLSTQGIRSCIQRQTTKKDKIDRLHPHERASVSQRSKQVSCRGRKQNKMRRFEKSWSVEVKTKKWEEAKDWQRHGLEVVQTKWAGLRRQKGMGNNMRKPSNKKVPCEHHTPSS